MPLHVQRYLEFLSAAFLVFVFLLHKAKSIHAMGKANSDLYQAFEPNHDWLPLFERVLQHRIRSNELVSFLVPFYADSTRPRDASEQ